MAPALSGSASAPRSACPERLASLPCGTPARAALALVVAERLGATADAARLGAAVIAHLRRAEIACHPSLQHMNERWQALLASSACLPDDLARWQREGEALDEAAIEAICLRAVQSFQGDDPTMT